jgi:hypothetical protein
MLKRLIFVMALVVPALVSAAPAHADATCAVKPVMNMLAGNYFTAKSTYSCSNPHNLTAQVNPQVFISGTGWVDLNSKSKNCSSATTCTVAFQSYACNPGSSYRTWAAGWWGGSNFNDYRTATSTAKVC